MKHLSNFGYTEAKRSFAPFEIQHKQKKIYKIKKEIC